LLRIIIYLVSGGFAIVNDDSSLNINAVEAFKLDDFSPEVNMLYALMYELVSNCIILYCI
jgi:F0F1-type ATP synthase epsilon subunit